MGKMQVGDLMAFIQYAMQIIMAFLLISMVSIMMPRAQVAAERVNEDLRYGSHDQRSRRTKRIFTREKR